MKKQIRLSQKEGTSERDMANRQQRRANKSKDRARQRSLTQREVRAINGAMRQVYIWRYTTEDGAQGRSAAGADPQCDSQGYGLLAPATPSRVEAACAVAKNNRLNWQVIQIAYCLDADGNEVRLWSWLKTSQPIIAAGDGMVPLLHRSYSACMAEIADGEVCVARGVIMAPWDARHPIRPDMLAAKLKTRLQLSDQEIQELADWGDPITAEIGEDETLDLELAKALRDDS